VHADTSDVYGPFTNEELVGKAIKGVSHLMKPWCLDRKEDLEHSSRCECLLTSQHRVMGCTGRFCLRIHALT
jgi:hypothetical protein